MDIWEQKLNIKRPERCNRLGLCCLSATSVKPWNKIFKARKDQYLRDFFNLFIPYEPQSLFKQKYPDVYKACIDIARMRKDIKLEDIYFYYCRFYKMPNHCPVYEDRPTVCRQFPDSPFDAIPHTCGYYAWSVECKQKYFEMQLELRKLKLEAYSQAPFFILSPARTCVGLVCG